MFLKAMSIKSRATWPAWTIMVLAILLPMKALVRDLLVRRLVW